MTTPQEQELLQQLLTPDTHRPWHRRWWGRVLLAIIVLCLALAALFASRVRYYFTAYSSGNMRAFEGIFIDASQYGGVGASVSRIDVETADDPSLGPADAKVVIVEFGDFGCPYCLENLPILKKMRTTYANSVRFIYRDFPQTIIHPTSQIAAEASECADDQKAFWMYHDLLYDRQNAYQTTDDLIGYAQELGLDETAFAQCLNSHRYESEVLYDLQDGIRFNLRGTPTFFVNGIMLSGVVSEEVFTALIEKLSK